MEVILRARGFAQLGYRFCPTDLFVRIKSLEGIIREALLVLYAAARHPS